MPAKRNSLAFAVTLQQSNAFTRDLGISNSKMRMTNGSRITSTFATRQSKFGSFAIRNSTFEISPRPNQVYQVKNIVQCIHENCGSGYIWSTNGSGKTLTSSKASTLLKDYPDIVKCIFVLDRKELDRLRFDCHLAPSA